ncbi:helix-turn-helix transcriptional regulator [Vibrio ezurae]|uniref:Helix-turn-helix domain-containing protein n=1 Tax=Vibrio ezurae NBRC 102218 TaxID=1219080 RepID=U3B5U5_9VIBR|nr:helix-turn-helix domain-containing protein [Vibrio ezurae]GAD81295.1 hypothetical protein VEZ01S_55_00110 [Vibrio ezurae NBRC 102218]
MSKCLTKNDVQKILNISKTTLERWIKKGCFIPGTQFGENSVRFRESEVSEYLDRVFAGEERTTVTTDIKNKRCA